MTGVVYAHASALVGGGNRVLLRLIDRLDRSRFAPLSVVPEDGPIRDELSRRGVACIVHDTRAEGLSPVRQARAAAWLAWRLARHAPGLLHANGAPYRLTAFGSMTARRVCHIHHPGNTPESLRWLLTRRPHAIITPSRLVHDGLVAALPAEWQDMRIDVVLNPVDTDWFRPAPDRRALRLRLRLDADAQHVSILGALAPHKGHVCFLKVARRVLAELSGTHFHVIGDAVTHDPGHGDSLRRLSQELGIADRVHFWGTVDDETARDLLCSSDLFLLPTMEEGFGLVLAEAQACEVPVLTSAIRPLDEVVDDGRTGHLVAPDDDQAFARHALRLLRDSEASRALGHAGRIWVQSRFGDDAYARRVTALYDTLLGLPTPAGT